MYSVTDPFNEWDDVLARATLRAMRDWWDDDVLPVLQPSMVAAAGEFTPLNIDAILSSLTAWESKYLAEVASLSQGLLAVRVAEVLQARGIDLSQLAPEGAVPSYDMSVTLQAASAAGIDVTAATVVVTVPGWHEFIDRYAQTRRNMVVGMPEVVYREVVTKLATATKDGMGPWERARLTREFLSWEDEGGYDAWMTRAHRISRTETNNIINAGDLQAARMETAATGQELQKVWLCVAPDTIVGSAYANFAARRRYEGPMVRVTTASGRSLSLTPEHPVLTGRGWVVADDLDLSDNLFEIVGTDPAGTPDVQDAPPSIGEIVDAAIDRSPAEVRSMRAGVNFDGHPVAGNVEVVPVNGQLALDLESAVAESVRDLHLADADRLAHGLVFADSSAGDDFAGNSSTAQLRPNEGVPGSFSGGIFVGGTNDTGSSPVPDRDALLAKQSGHHVVTSVQLCRNCGCGQPIHVSSRYVPSVEVSASSGRGPESLGGTSLLDGSGVTLEAETSAVPSPADGNAALAKSAGHGAVVGADDAGNLPEGVSRLVEPDDVVNVERYTFVGHVYDLSTAAQWYEANGLVVHNCTLDPRTRDSHFRADGQRVPLDGKFIIGGHAADHPSDSNLPAHESINCVVGSTKLAWPRQGVASSTKREHVGAFVDLVTADGNTLTVTPNHPVLTPSGYVAAGSLREGDHVLSASVASSPQVDNVPPRADEFHRALRQSGVQERVVAGAVDFHGDAAEGNEVEVVRPDRDLVLKIDTFKFASGAQDARFVGLNSGSSHGSTFSCRQASLLDAAMFVDVDVAGTSARGVRSGGEFAALVLPQSSHAQPVSFAPATHGKIEFVKPTNDSGSGDSELARHLEHAHAVGMKPTKLVEVKRYSGRHDVYNLSTTDEWYIANGIAVHNCRCSMMLLTPDEALPDESDRQTERERSDGTRRDPHAEVRARAERDVTRARDDEPQPVTAAAEGATPMTRTQWSGILAPIGKPTGDGRIFDTDAELDFREFPLPLMFQRATGDGHDTAVVVGKITAATIESDAVHAVGEFFDNAEAADAAELVAEGVIRPSVDLTDMVIEYELTDRDGNPIAIDDNGELPEGVTYEDMQEVMHVRAATIMAATLVAKPAFAEAKITIGDEVPAPEGADAAAEQAALLAAAAPVLDVADADAFADPKLTGPTPLTVTEDGWVFGHLALWGTEHIGMPGRSVTPPRSNTNYAMFHTGTIRTTAGDLAVGRLTVGTGHAVAHANVAATTAHYDETGTCWAFVRAGEDAHGIFVAGVINPDANAAQVRAGAAAPLSGDWRAVGGNLELVAALSVNTPGFPVSRSYANTAGAELSLVASGVVPRRTKADEMADAVAEGLRRHEERKAAEQAALDEAMADAERLQRARSMKAQMLVKGLQ